MYRFGRSLSGGSMKKFVYAAVAAAVLGVAAAGGDIVTADQSAPSQPSQTPAATKPSPVKMATSHTTVKPAAPAGLAVDSQNKLVGQYCATCHSERGKAGSCRWPVSTPRTSTRTPTSPRR